MLLFKCLSNYWNIYFLCLFSDCSLQLNGVEYFAPIMLSFKLCNIHGLGVLVVILVNVLFFNYRHIGVLGLIFIKANRFFLFLLIFLLFKYPLFIVFSLPLSFSLKI